MNRAFLHKNQDRSGIKTGIYLTFAVYLSSLLLLNPAKAQIYKFQQFQNDKGSYNPFVYSVTQDNHAFIWTLTGEGLWRFDGFKFLKNGGFRDSLPEASAEVSFRDKNNHLWFGYNDGTIVYFNGKTFRIFRAAPEEYGRITGITADGKGNIIAANQNHGLILINSNLQKKNITLPGSNNLYCFSIDGNKIITGTDEGLLTCTLKGFTATFLSKIEGLPPTKINRIQKRKHSNTYWVATEDAGLFILTPLENGKYNIEDYGSRYNLSAVNVQSVMEDSENNLWISTFGNGIYKITSDGSLTGYNSGNGLPCDDIKETYQDFEGNIWIATYGKGILKVPNESFSYFNFEKAFKDNNITAVCFEKNGYWLGGNRGILHISNGLESKFYGAAAGIPADIITSLFVDKKENVWIGTAHNGIFQLSSGRIKPYFRMENSLANSIHKINGVDDVVYAGTKNGVYKFNLKTNKRENFSTSEGLTHNDIRDIYIDPTGIVWIATHSSQLFSLNSPVKFNLTGTGEIEFSSIASDSNGNIWAGTNGNGIFKFSNDTFSNLSARNGLYSDYCYATVCDKWNNIWTGHRMGISRINSKTHQVEFFGSGFFPGNVNQNAMARNDNGDILFGTTEGLVYYDAPTKNKISLPPVVNIISTSFNDSVCDHTKKIVLSYSTYRLNIDFIGLNYSNPEQVKYKYKLEGFENEWTETSGQTAKYPRIEDGKYTFILKACNGEGACSETTISIQIRKPFWKMWWFFTACFVFFALVVWFIIKIREKRAKEFRYHLEKLLEERTREVREQKEEIEIINRDITDSINYAKRIQSSILPSLKKLQNIFGGSFVYYLPRNIVSGDFYWFDLTPDNQKFLIVCADSTGHGVPGAFMSIIGATLLKDIFAHPEVKKPSDILMRLDNQIRSIMNQNMDGEQSSDGMDIIVCEIDVHTHLARFSSAMRPFIVYRNGEQLYFKGSKNSIGGQVKDDKQFEDVEIQLSRGDIIYMFSDGYPDQFGGPSGKKLKMVRLRNMLKDIYQKPMEEQYNHVKLNFENWKGEQDQVDDVLFMGIKI